MKIGKKAVVFLEMLHSTESKEVHFKMAHVFEKMKVGMRIAVPFKILKEFIYRSDSGNIHCLPVVDPEILVRGPAHNRGSGHCFSPKISKNRCGIYCVVSYKYRTPCLPPHHPHIHTHTHLPLVCCETLHVIKAPQLILHACQCAWVILKRY